MREYSTPPAAPPPTSGNLTDDVVRRAATEPTRAAFARRTSDGFVDVSAQEFLDRCRALARGMIEAGVKTGDRVILLSSTRFEWTLADYAIWFAGAVSVPIYANAGTDHLRHVLRDSGARWAVVETSAHRRLVDDAQDRERGPVTTWSIDEDDLPWSSWPVGSPTGSAGPDPVHVRRDAIGPGSPATLLYTSGTTGPPKGCVLTHGALMAELDAALVALAPLFEEEGAATLLFLPLPHIFARIIQVGAVRAGVRLGYGSRAGRFLDDLATVRPTFVLAVPRVFEQIYNTASQQAAADGRTRSFERATDAAIAWSRAQEHRGAPLRLRLLHRSYDRRVYAALRDLLGGRCRYAVSGGAPLGERLGHFYRGIGVTVLEGYGLTETSGAVTVNTPDVAKVGTVGRPLPGSAVRVADDGELLVTGPQIMAGYWDGEAQAVQRRDPSAWFETGDLAEIDDEGFVTVTGRIQEILVTAGGKTVSPSVLEDRIRAHPLVSQCLVLGDRKPFVTALVTLDKEAWPDWARRHGLGGQPSRHVDDPAVRGEIDRAVAAANAAVSQAEAIRRFVVLPVDFTEDQGHLTPSLKLRRRTIVRDFRDEIEALYSS